MNRILSSAAFVAGLLALGWIGLGYVGGHVLALAMTALIAAFYLLGGLELWRFQQATAGLSQALAALPENLPQLDGWLATLPPALHNPVRLRIEGERVALPGPALTPYLVGLLVLLGMLGTFLGMVVTLNGTVSALESTTDLASIRASLAAPVKGLGLAFGTSVAGVAASAMLGLVSALCRRERLQAAQALDSKIATVLRGFSLVHQRQEGLRTQQAQAQLMPQLVDRLQAMMLQMEQQSQALNDRLLSNQKDSTDRLLSSQQALGERLLANQQDASERLLSTQKGLSEELLSGQRDLSRQLQAGQDIFHRQAETAYAGLAASVDQSLKHSLAESARLAGEAIQPTVEAAMSSIGREATALHARVADAVQLQLDGVSQRFGHAVNVVADGWREALAQHAQTSAALAAQSQAALAAFAQTFEQRSAALLAAVDQAQAESRSLAVQQDTQRLQGWTHTLEVMASTLQREWRQAGEQHLAQQEQMATVAQSFELRSVALLAAVDQAQAESRAVAVQQDAQRLQGWTQALEVMAATLQREWQQAGAQHLAQQEHLATVAQSFEQRSAALLAAVDQAQAEARAAALQQDEQRLQGWTQSLEAMAGTLQREWRQAGEHSLAQQQQICETLDQTARSISSQAEAHARNTIAEVAQLMQAASEAPRVAAEVIGQLRQQLSDSMARDNSLLDERQRMMATLSEVLDAVHQASTDQRGAVDALVSSTAATLDRVGSQLSETIVAEAGELSAAAAQITGSAVEVASLGEAFGSAVQLFGESNDKLMAQLQQIEAALAKSTTRSDEQLAYYVAQAREIIDLSLMSQKQIVDDLQRLAAKQALAAGEAA